MDSNVIFLIKFSRPQKQLQKQILFWENQEKKTNQ